MIKPEYIKQIRTFPCFNDVFDYKRKERFRIVPKGRRLGFTAHSAIYSMIYLQSGISPILWGDVTYSNIDKYIATYFNKFARKTGINITTNKGNKTLEACGGQIHFRSADYPENWESFGYKAIILNEAGIILKNDYLWNNAVMPMMLDHKDSFAIIGGTPKGKRTKKGKHKFFELYEYGLQNPDRYLIKQLSTHNNPFIDKDEIKLMEKALPQSVIRQEIYGEFIDNEDSLLKDIYIRHTNILPEKLYYYIGVDLAISTKTQADYTAVSVVGIDKDRNVYVVEVHRFKDDRLHEIVKQIIALAEKYNSMKVLVENNQFQSIIVKELVKHSALPIKGIRADVDKITRFYPMLAKYENGLIYHYSKMRNLKDYEDELLAFPDGQHDDMVDATVYAVLGTNEMIF